jgi:hypothetical protein
MIEINKEVLESIRMDEYKILEIIYDKEDKKVGCLLNNNQWYFISIYELAHKCKEWAFANRYEIVVLAYMIRIYRDGYEVYYANTKLFDLDKFFRACEWILNDTKRIKLESRNKMH